MKSTEITAALKSRLDSILLSVLETVDDKEMSFTATATDLSGTLKFSFGQHVLRWITTTINEGFAPVREEDIKIETADINEEDRKYSLAFTVENYPADKNRGSTPIPHYSLTACSGAIDLLDTLLSTDEGNSDILSSISDVLMRVLVAYNVSDKEDKAQSPMEDIIRSTKKLSKKISELVSRTHSKVSHSEVS